MPPCSAPCAATKAARSASRPPSPRPTPAGAAVDWRRLLRRLRGRRRSRCPPTPSSASATGWTAASAGRSRRDRPKRRPSTPSWRRRSRTPRERRSPSAAASPWQSTPGWPTTPSLGTAILPGTAFVELALLRRRAGRRRGLEELTLQAPLVLPEDRARLQVSLAAPDQEGRREIAIHSAPRRAEEGAVEPACRRHPQRRGPRRSGLRPRPPGPPRRRADRGRRPATTASPRPASNTAPPSRASAPPGATAMSSTPRSRLPAEPAGEAARFAMHPALLDAALHPVVLRRRGRGVRLPFAWSGVSPGGRGGRPRAAGPAQRHGEDVSVSLVDASGAPMVRVDSLRPVRSSRGSCRAPPRPTALRPLAGSEPGPSPAA